MKIKIINPNTSSALNEELRREALKVVRPSTEIIAASPEMGPSSIESFYDEYLSIPGLFKEIRKGDAEEGADAYVIACFGDPGLLGARELTSAPVLGIAEAAMTMASMIAATFSIVTTLPRTRLMSEHLVQHYGMREKCRSVRTTSLHVLDVLADPDASVRQIAEECRKAVEEDRAEAIVLGCAAMAAHKARIERLAGVPVVDGVLAAVKYCEALVDLGAKTSKSLTFAEPEKKTYTGMLRSFGR
ncbi:aspartate/glutamate racemase family protein [Paenibacillus sp.]|uniref:aspartate/glutamate racemase family protein n=1 Tax=Paenibacillus sp. TaxID=58172 RepID=UPI002D50422A|nr:aspartate/glutamate racemase family protein [Paenibacillus sp.]HZG85809.1 aspartate/glutamate racemase family protein [Paenibacillus sp.]